MTSRKCTVRQHVRTVPEKPRILENETHQRLMQEVLDRDLPAYLESALNDPAFAATLGLV